MKESANAALSDKIKASMELEISGKVLLYLYLGIKSFVLEQSENTIELTDETSNNIVLVFAKDDLNSSGDFIVPLNWNFAVIKVEGVDAYNNKLAVYLPKNYKGESCIKAEYQKVFAIPENKCGGKTSG